MLKNFGLCYLATPYSKYPWGTEEAFRDACRLAAQLIRQGVNVYSPIAHTHPIAVQGKLDPFDHSLWLPFDETMMRLSSVLVVAHMDGWQESKGIAHEVAFFKRLQKIIFDLDPVTLVATERR